MKPDFSDFSSLANTLFRPAVGPVYADGDGELSIHDAKRGLYYGLDPVGARIWALLMEWNTVSEIRATLLDEYDVEPSQLDEDMVHLLNELFTRGLIEVAPAAAKPRSIKQFVPELR